ncbi:Uncharacterised protein [Bacteroides xylanisolvens]|nr:Uncharacterised protein [Bacteroides xylanisolvens]
MRKYRFPTCSPSPSVTTRSSARRVPRPIICQNFVFERTFLKKTKFTHSGTSIPVSIISTDTAMTGSLSGFLKSAINVSAYESSQTMRRAKCPWYSGYISSKQSTMNCACFLFSAKMIVFPSRSPPETLMPFSINRSMTVRTVSRLKTFRFIFDSDTYVGRLPSSSMKSSSYRSRSSGVSLSYVIPSCKKSVFTS